MVQPIAATPPLSFAPSRLTVFDTGSEQCPQGQLPGQLEFTPEEAENALNPLQYVPVVGMLYRQATGETVPPPFLIAGSVVSSAIMGGPLGIVGSLLVNFVMELARLGPDTSRPAVPEGMDVTGSETAMRKVSPGSITTPGGYTTLATTIPDFLGGSNAFAEDGTSYRKVFAAYQAGTMFGGG